MRLAILGIGSVRCGPPVISALTTYFGERPLEVRLFDADEERLDLFERLARVCFQEENNEHDLLATSDVGEALERADQAILMVGENCARKFLMRELRPPEEEEDESIPIFLEGTRDELIGRATTEMLEFLPDGAPILTMLRGEGIRFSSTRLLEISRLPWPPEPPEEDRWRIPHQILRWIRGDDPLFGFLEAYMDSPMKQWLNDPTPTIVKE